MGEEILVPGHVAEARRQEAAAAQRPLAGVLIAGYGSYVNPAFITKMEPVSQGTDWFVVAYLNSDNDMPNANAAFLTPPLASEEEAARACDQLAAGAFYSFASHPDGRAHWRFEYEDQAPDSTKPVLG